MSRLRPHTALALFSALAAPAVALTGCDGAGPPAAALARAITSVATVTVAAEGHRPIDAAASSDGRTIWFLGADGGDPALFRISAEGGVKTLLTGAPLLGPRGLAISHDGKRV
ncbi:MAG: hypothetical protein EXR72_13970 [Myxococcales bacterium]|nr:hypothetical protein [Myxococcales bacterium]